ncbi:hypothetical protein [Deinococcus sp. AJ005]|uniref:hypothetical protein n=1 Tax=Deinococcus sp. AJ005 TaxID=2652443 RepID=UPI00125CC619|nr:hypothetical protein [Deinococcus sp. AJ005]QFP75041.1 hypothetical protein DAAJ005_00305 [Deinococcus sp. AJ005]
MTAIQPTTKAPASLAFVKDTNDLLANPATEGWCNPETGIRLTHTTVPSKQVFVCRTAEGVLQGFYPVDPPAAPNQSSGTPSALTPTRLMRTSSLVKVQPALTKIPPSPGKNSGAAYAQASTTPTIPAISRQVANKVIPGIYAVTGDEKLKDLKLTVRAPVFIAFWLILAGVVFSTLVGLLLTRWSAIQQLRVMLKMQGFDEISKLPLIRGNYALNTSDKELRAYLTWYKFWLPTEHAERLAQALLDWRTLSDDVGRLDDQMKMLEQRNFKKADQTDYFVIDMLNRVQLGGANRRKDYKLDEMRQVEIQEVEPIQKTIYEATLLAEHLTTYRLLDEIKVTGSPDLEKARSALLRELDDVTDWQGLTAAEFQKFLIGLSVLRTSMLEAFVVKQDGEIAAFRANRLRPPQMNAARRRGSASPLILANGVLPHRRRAPSTTLASIAPLLLWNWMGVLVGALVAWLLGSVTGLQTLYFTGQPWGSTIMDYVTAFTYGAVTVAAVASLAGVAKTLLPMTEQFTTASKPPLVADAVKGKTA